MDCRIPLAAIPDTVDCRRFLIIVPDNVEKHIIRFCLMTSRYGTFSRNKSSFLALHERAIFTHTILDWSRTGSLPSASAMECVGNNLAHR
jgi:hypothetical protein